VLARDDAQLLDVADQRLVRVRETRIGHVQIAERRREGAGARRVRGQRTAHRLSALALVGEERGEEDGERGGGCEHRPGPGQGNRERAERDAQRDRRGDRGHGDMHHRCVGAARGALAARSRGLQIGDLHCLERRPVRVA